jgi:hypothetical protein
MVELPIKHKAKNMKNKFNNFERVKVISSQEALAEINNCEGYIVGMSQAESTGEWYYGVTIPADDNQAWSIVEHELEAIGGKIDPKEIWPDDLAVRVQVDPKTGEGNLVEPDEDE